jgi:hypothetical protein
MGLQVVIFKKAHFFAPGGLTDATPASMTGGRDSVEP